MQKIRLFLSSLVFLVLVSAFSFGQKSTSNHLNIDDNWKFHFGNAADPAVELPFVKSKSFDVESHGFKPVGGAYPESSIGWYRKHIAIPATDSGKRYQIQFDGIFRDAKIWINGFYLGNNLSGYMGASYDLTDYLKFGKDNIVVVRVDATQYEGWFYEGTLLGMALVAIPKF